MLVVPGHVVRLGISGALEALHRRLRLAPPPRLALHLVQEDAAVLQPPGLDAQPLLFLLALAVLGLELGAIKAVKPPAHSAGVEPLELVDMVLDFLPRRGRSKRKDPRPSCVGRTGKI